MKKSLFFLMMVSAVFFFSCKNDNGNDWEGTKLTVEAGNWPENVQHIQLGDSKSWLNLYKAGTCQSNLYFKGEVTLRIDYFELTEEDKKNYFAYGTLKNSETPFKVYVNGVEVENQFPQETVSYNNEKLELNANIRYFKYTFDIGEALEIKLTFQNAPEKILRKDVRLSDETSIAYFDIDDLKENYKSVNLYYNNNNQLDDIYPVIPNGLLFFDIYKTEYYCYITAKDNYYVSSSLKVEPASYNEVEIINNNESYNYCDYKIIFSSIPKKRSVIKLSGETKPFDTKNFAGKTLNFVKNSAYIGQVNNASLELSDKNAEENTFTLNLNNQVYTGNWIIKNEKEIELKFNSETQSEQVFAKAELEYEDTAFWQVNSIEIQPPSWRCSLYNNNYDRIYDFFFKEQ